MRHGIPSAPAAPSLHWTFLFVCLKTSQESLRYMRDKRAGRSQESWSALAWIPVQSLREVQGNRAEGLKESKGCITDSLYQARRGCSSYRQRWAHRRIRVSSLVHILSPPLHMPSM